MELISNMKKILIGSNVFFSRYNDFISKDKDYAYIINDSNYGHTYSYKHYIGVCVIKFVNLDKERLMRIFTTKKVLPMSLCQFLVPEFAEYFGITIDDLKKLKKLRDTLDYKHLYLRIIYDAYLENGKFELTQEQRDRAYASYKSWRPDFYD